ncbi:YcfL family protein [Vibrio cholerae]|uniref:YcfL family protein n=1 Tax=Vibrio cholerae TaxID=666 RepID=UPI000E0C1F32|nr:YcfL family protein [Vibrio cholerae]EJL6427350.1 YcfL family protein [Vibrio cholerae]EJL6504148.1 YcfL family protein [Vibrio cholerae]EKF9660048.1 YcfL family protein [Vibrio cholerae]ELJ8446422.1 YcfL family protein [Vibrio cholerae]ELJ8726162.1 YcfL family protein [Vibrio cholerae]
MRTWLLAVLTALLLVGCSTNTAGLRVDGASQQVLFNDSALSKSLSIEDISTTAVDGHTRGVVRLQSNQKSDVHVQYRFYWYDNDGLEVNTKLSPWKTIILRGMETVSLTEVSVNPNGKQFRVQIRESDQ